MNMKDKSSQVREILLLPIVCSKENNQIYIKDKVIYTGQKYYSYADEDMSDFSCGFYEIVYEEVLCKKGILDEKGHICDCNFAGDTINSFNSIANIVKEAGETNRKRTSKCYWPSYLQKYYDRYHCLANFWLLPMCVGRGSAKFNRFDSIDIFLNVLKEDYNILNKYVEYFKFVNNNKEFCKKHFIEDYNPVDTAEVRRMYNEGQAEKLINRAYKLMESRANSISLDTYTCEKLYNYFKKLDLL